MQHRNLVAFLPANSFEYVVYDNSWTGEVTIRQEIIDACASVTDRLLLYFSVNPLNPV
jgi:hypothetical protein